MITFKEIAKRTGTSPSMVSRVFNNSGYVSQNKREIIENELRKQGYQVTSRRNTIPRSANKIVMIIAETLENAPYIEYVEGISSVLQSNNLLPLVYVSYHSPENEIEQIKYATDLGVGGILMLSAIESTELLILLQELTCPIVLMNRRIRTADIDSVVMDNYKVGYLATRYLIKHGHEHIACIAGPANSTPANDRKTGFLDALSEAGLPHDESQIFYGDLSYKRSKKLATEILESSSSYTAVFAGNDTMALGFIDGLYEIKLRCPDDFSVICAENTLDTRIGKVEISSIGYDNVQMAKSAAELLIERKIDPKGKRKLISYSPNLYERDSVKTII